MKSTSATCRSPRRALRGFGAVLAIFILVALAVLGTALVTIFSGQQRSVAFDSLGIQAYQGARAGIEFGVYQALHNNACANTSFALPGTLSGFSVNVQCARTSHTELATSTDMFRITATACNRGSCPASADATYVERELRVVVGSKAP